MSLSTALSNFWNNDVEPLLKTVFGNVVKSEVAALTPIVANALAAEESNIVKAAASGSLAGLAVSSAAILTSAATQAEVQGVSAGISSLLATVSTAINNHPAVAITALASTAAP